MKEADPLDMDVLYTCELALLASSLLSCRIRGMADSQPNTLESLRGHQNKTLLADAGVMEDFPETLGRH